MKFARERQKLKIKMKLFLITFLFIVNSSSIMCQNFSGYYVERITKNKDGSVSFKEFIMDEETLLDFIEYSTNDIWGIKKEYTRLFNFIGHTFERLPKTFWPTDCGSKECIDWNYKVSLHRTNYSNMNKIWLQKNVLANRFTYAFHIKEVTLQIDSLGSAKELREMGSTLDIGPVARNYLSPTSSDSNVLLRKIYSQRLMSNYEMEQLGLTKFLKPIPEKIANNEFHPETPSYYHDERGKKLTKKQRKRYFECLCNSNIPGGL